MKFGTRYKHAHRQHLVRQTNDDPGQCRSRIHRSAVSPRINCALRARDSHTFSSLAVCRGFCVYVSTWACACSKGVGDGGRVKRTRFPDANKWEMSRGYGISDPERKVPRVSPTIIQS